MSAVPEEGCERETEGGDSVGSAPSHGNRDGQCLVHRTVSFGACAHVRVRLAWLSTRSAVDTGSPADLEDHGIKPEQGKECVT